jgi:hypothetical protein
MRLARLGIQGNRCNASSGLGSWLGARIVADPVDARGRHADAAP